MLSLISCDIVARIDQFELSLKKAADIAEESLLAAAANADQFQSAFDRAANAVGQSSQKMASDFEAANDRLIGAADQSSQKMANDFEAANDRIASAADQSAEALDHLSKATDKVDARSWIDKLTTAMATGFGAAAGATVTAFDKIAAGIHTAFDAVENYLATKIKAIVIGLFLGVFAAGLYTLYETAKTVFHLIGDTVDFVKGLFTGDSYKSESIDAVLALNKELKPLQEGLQLSAEHAAALNEALKETGVGASSYVSTLNGAEKAARTNAASLEELGIETHDYFGEVRSSEDILRSAKRVLDEYSEGYDRNAAAAAIGLGSYKEITDTLSITNAKVEESGQRLAEYGLIIGPGTQAAVTEYEAAMQVFQRETDLTAQGFKKAIADQIMPLFTDLSTLFSDGWPRIVTVFRVSLATITTLLYGLKEVAQIVSGAVMASFGSMGDVISRVADALIRAASGDMAGAWAQLKAVPDDLGSRWGAYWTKLQSDSKHNLAAMNLAWGADNDTSTKFADPAKTGKKWHPPASPETPDDPKTPRGSGSAAATTSAYQTFLDQLDQMNARMDGNQYTMLKVKAAQLAWAEGISATTALAKIEALQIAESDKAVKDYGTRLDEENRRLLDARGAIGLVGVELDAYNLREQRRAEAIAKVNQAMAAGKPLTDEATAALLANAAASAKDAEAILRENDAISRTFEVGAKKAFDTYMDNATNAAKQAETAFTQAFQAIDTAMGDFLFNPFDKGVKGMLSSFGTAVQKMISQAVAADLGKRLLGAATESIGSGILGTAMRALGIGTGSITAAAASKLPGDSLDNMLALTNNFASYAVGTNYVPRDMLAQIHQGERIIPAAQNVPGLGAPSLTLVQHFHGNASAQDVRRAGGDTARSLIGLMTGAQRYV